jgi:hypothetical protein
VKKNIPVLLLAILISHGAVFAQVPYERLVKAESEPANWLTYGGSYK